MNYRLLFAALSTASLLLITGCGTKSNEQPAVLAPSSEPLDVPPMQMAIVQVGTGGPEVLESQSVPVLDPGPGEVLIKVVAAAINPIDWRNRENDPRPTGPRGAENRQPDDGSAPRAIPGGDLSGIVVRLGEGVTNVAVGDAVFAKLAGGPGRLNGSYSEYAVAPADQTNLKPSDQTFAEASGLGTVGVTALRTIKHANVSEGQRVFINGIAGGIGSSAAQFALDRGAYVVGTASGGHHKYLNSIGVHEAINYREVQFDEVIEEPVDVVIETVSTATANQALNILKPGGQLVSIAGAADPELCEAKGVNCSRIGGEFGWPNSEMLAEVAQLAESGIYRLNVDTTFPLQEAGAAQDLNHNVGTRGKIVLIVDADLAFKK